MPLFADASYYIALMRPSDQWHRAALHLMETAEDRGPLHTTVLVLAEVLAQVGAAQGGKAAQRAYEAIVDDGVIHYPDAAAVHESMGLVVRYDGRLSLADAVTLHLMERAGARELLSFDRDFDGKGVQRLHGPRR